jgi:hypothetical protein
VDQRAFLELLRPIQDALVEDQLAAYREFDKHHRASVRVHVEPARPKWVNCWTMHLLEMRYGTGGDIRVVTKNRLKYLFIPGPEFNLGIRAKKFGPDWRTYQHRSGQQDRLRRSGRFSWHKKTLQLFLGYRDSGGLQPAITDVAITRESKLEVCMIAHLWTPAQGIIRIQEIQENLPLPKPTTIRPRRRRSEDGEQEKKNKKSG